MSKLFLFFSISTIPITLLWLGIIPFEQRFTVLGVHTCFMICYSLYRKFSLFELGFRKDTLYKSLKLNGLLSLSMLLLIFTLYKLNLIRNPTVPEWDLFFIFYIFFSSPAQEFLYRSLVFAELTKNGYNNPLIVVLITAINYAYLHIFYNDSITFFTTMLIGIIWGIIYIKQPNFWGVAFSHAVLGAASIFVGLI